MLPNKNIHEILVFTLGTCNMGCSGCSLENPARNSKIVLKNLMKFFMENHQYFSPTTPTVTLESAGLLKQVSFIESPTFEAMLELFSSYGIKILKNLDYHTHYSPEVHRSLNKLLEKYDLTLLIGSPVIKFKEFTEKYYLSDDHRILAKSALLLRDTQLSEDLFPLSKQYVFNSKCADLSKSNSNKEDQERFLSLLRHLIKTRKSSFREMISLDDPNEGQIVALIDDTTDVPYLTLRGLCSSKYLFSIPMLSSYLDTVGILDEKYNFLYEGEDYGI